MAIKFHFFNGTLKYNANDLPEDLGEAIAPLVEAAEDLELDEGKREIPAHRSGLVSALFHHYVRFLTITRQFRSR